MSYFQYSMTARLELLTFASRSTPRTLSYKVLFASAELERALPFDAGARLRIVGEIEDVPVRLAWQPSGERGHYVLVGPAVVKALGLRIGDEVTLRFDLDDQDGVVVPDELLALLETTTKRRKLWAALTPGRQRGLAHLVASAKTSTTRERRASLVVEKLEAGLLDELAPPKRRRT
jgi:hypothetical protein